MEAQASNTKSVEKNCSNNPESAARRDTRLLSKGEYYYSSLLIAAINVTGPAHHTLRGPGDSDHYLGSAEDFK